MISQASMQVALTLVGPSTIQQFTSSGTDRQSSEDITFHSPENSRGSKAFQSSAARLDGRSFIISKLCWPLIRAKFNFGHIVNDVVTPSAPIQELGAYLHQVRLYCKCYYT